ncbi:MAG: hypothetical protein ACFHXK_11280 [bacterium]
MEWTIFALVQMFIITVGTCLAFWLRLRGVSRQNAQLRQALEAHNETSDASPAVWVQEQLAKLPADSPTAPIISLILQHALAPGEDLDSLLHQAIADAGFASDAGHQEALAALQAELDATKAAADAIADGSTENDRTEELKQLLQQFTRDSREMMACIQSLETENAALRKRLGLDESDAVLPESEQAPATENTEDAA